MLYPCRVHTRHSGPAWHGGPSLRSPADAIERRACVPEEACRTRAQGLVLVQQRGLVIEAAPLGERGAQLERWRGARGERALGA